MKKITLLLLVMLATGCHKREDGGPPNVGGTLPGGGATVMIKYAGAVAVLNTATCLQSCFQDIPVNANVIDHPSDAVMVYLCRNAVCSVDALPAQTCAQIGIDPSAITAPCYTTSPTPYIVLGKKPDGSGLVRLANAFTPWCLDLACSQKVPGFGSYAIETIVTR